MLEFFTGIISGTVSGTGMGGGTILILILSVFMGIDQHVAQATNLIFFVPTSIVAICMNVKNKIIDYKKATIIIFSGTLGAILGSKLSFVFESEKQRNYFGIFLLIIAFFEVYTNGRLVLGNGLKMIENRVFGAGGFYGDLIIPDSVETIGTYAFADTSFEGGLVLGEGLWQRICLW